MHLCGLLEGHDIQLAQEIRLWLDRDANTSTGNHPSVNPQSVPRIKGSRNIHSETSKGINKFKQKRKYKRDDLESVIVILNAK
jgi:hypothetical protein